MHVLILRAKGWLYAHFLYALKSYGPANIRFKKSLGLSEIKINPPCAPKVYQRLYRYLEGVLPVGTKSRTRAPATNKLLATPSPSPIKQKRASKPGTNIEIVARRNQAQHESQAPLSESGWIMPAIRVFCKDLNAPAAPPHVFAGVLSVLTLTPPIKITNEHFTEAKSANGGMSGLLIATCLLVCARLSGVRTHPDDYQRRRDAGLKLLNQSFPQGEACAEDVNRWLRRIRDEGWTRLDWFTNIKEGAGLEIERGSPNSEEPPHIDGATEQEETPRIRRGLISMARVEEISIQAGIGTMV